MITSPSCIPAFADGLFENTATTAAPRVFGGSPICTAASLLVIGASVAPIHACWSFGLLRISSITERAESIEIAKPTFSAPFAATVLIPISLPVASISAPPELPGLIAASVCSSPCSSGPVWP